MKKSAFLKGLMALPLGVLFICCSRQQLLAQDSSLSGQGVAKNAAMQSLLEQQQLTQQDKKKIKAMAEEKAKEEQEFASQQKKVAMDAKDRQRLLAEEEIRLQQDLEAKQKELASEIEAKKRQIALEEERRLKEIKLKQEDLIRQIEARQKEIMEQQGQRLTELKEKQAQLERMREENLKKIAKEQTRRQLEFARLDQERQEKELRLQQQAQAKREKEEKSREGARKKDQEQQELNYRRQEIDRQRTLEAQRKQEEVQDKKAWEERLRLEKAAREKTAKEKEESFQKIKQEQDLKEKQEQLAQEKLWRERKGMAQTAPSKGSSKTMSSADTQLRAKNSKIPQALSAKNKSAAQLKKKQDDLDREKEKWQEKVEREKLKLRKERIIQRQKDWEVSEMQAMLERERRLRRRAEQKAGREEELRAKQEQLTRQKTWQEKMQLAEKPVQARKAVSAPKTTSTSVKEKAWQPNSAQKQKTNEKALAKSNMQEVAMNEAKTPKYQEDAEKIKHADELWIRARKLYGMGMYSEAIKDFQEIIKIEGNPRIKYTPSAKDYIEKSNAKIEEKENLDLEKKIDKKDKEMLNEVITRQLPPYVEPPEIVERSKEPSLFETPVIRNLLREKKISMDFDQVDLKSVITFLSQESGINFIASQKVLTMAFKVTARFDQTPVDEVVKYVTKSLGLFFRIDKEVVWIAHPEEIAQEALETRVYNLNMGAGLFTEFTGVSGGSTESGLGSSSAQINKIFTIEDTLKEVVSWPQDAKLTFDKRVNALIVRNTPQNLQMLEDVIYNLDITPMQILVEARFLEVDVTDSKEFGLDWKLNSDLPTQEKDGVFSQGFAKDSGSDFSNFSRVSEGLNLTYKGVLTTPQFQVVLHALEESKKIKTLSSPRVTTLNNQMATIKVVDEWIYPTRYDYEIVQFDLNGDGDYNDAGETTYKNVPKDFIRRDVGILLKVIPSIGADRKTISLSLIPEVSEATPDFFTYTGDVKLPKFTSRNLSTTVVVESGETVVLGGLIKESTTKVVTKVPFLGDVPFLGNFFRKNTDSVERKNLIIFVTAKMLTPSGEEVNLANAK